jgi:hydroxyethylthiazole kinase-like uncharacterized protein yjeF
MTDIIFKAGDVYAQEQKAVEFGISLDQLMSKAGKAVVDVILERLTPQKTLILVGPGNNGGDGYVVTKLLQEKNWDVVVASLEAKPPKSPLALEKYKEWGGTLCSLESVDLEDYSLIIDALFGIGLIKPLESPFANFVKKVNESSAQIVSIDIPSGLYADQGSFVGHVIQANMTITFNFLKPCHVLLPSQLQCGDIIVKDIGIPVPYPILWQKNDPSLWRVSIPRPHALSHKYQRGHLALIGSREMSGAARLASMSARKAGIGLLSVLCPKDAELIYAFASPGHLIKPYSSLDEFQSILESNVFSGFSIGSGLLPNEETISLVSLILAQKKPSLLDAGALMAFVNHPESLFKQLHKNCVLTPHEGEFKRLFKKDIDFTLSKIEQSLLAAKISKAVILYKGGDTIIAHPDGRILVENEFAPYLATAGSGDVLAGLVASLLAQNMDPLLASGSAAFMQRQAARKLGPGLIAEDLPQKIPDVLFDLLEF